MKAVLNLTFEMITYFFLAFILNKAGYGIFESIGLMIVIDVMYAMKVTINRDELIKLLSNFGSDKGKTK